MSQIKRRDFLKFTAASGAAAGLGVLGHVPAARASTAQVVIVGGGFGGATCAKYLRRAGINVTLIEPNTKFLTCPFSNYVIGGMLKMDYITHGYDNLRNKHGVNVVHDTVMGIDANRKQVTLKSGKKLSYDRLVVSPGISLKWNAIKGYDEKAAQIMPHAWKPGAQTQLLRRQLESMKDGGLVVMVAPPNPFRCPPGPYERAGMIANYLKAHKPKSKILILDPKDKFSKQGLFMDGWKKLYGNMIEWVPGSKGGKVDSVNTKTMVVDALDKHKAAVANVIPPQSAGTIALKSGLADASGWCPIHPNTFESKLVPNVHVLGDSTIATPMPKSGFIANSHGKMCASAIAALLRGEPVPTMSFANTCYSLVGPDYGISVAAVYRVGDKGFESIKGAGGVSPKDADASFRAAEAKYAFGWYASITADIWDT